MRILSRPLRAKTADHSDQPLENLDRHRRGLPLSDESPPGTQSAPTNRSRSRDSRNGLGKLQRRGRHRALRFRQSCGGAMPRARSTSRSKLICRRAAKNSIKSGIRQKPVDRPRAVRIDSVNRVGNAPRVDRGYSTKRAGRSSLLKNLPTGLAPVESGLCTTQFQLDTEVVQKTREPPGQVRWGFSTGW